MRRLFCIIIAVTALAACQEQQYILYDTPFAYILDNDDSAFMENTTVPSMANNLTKTYRVILSTKAFEEPITVKYEISVGDGLVEGVDYKVITQGDELTFLPGIYKMPVRITFLRNTLDSSKDNSITISLKEAGSGMELGFPGPAHRNSYHRITKIN